MNFLKRELAPILPEAWKLIDEQAIRVLSVHLAGRRLIDIPHARGWDLAAVPTGRVESIESPALPKIQVGVRQVQALVELRCPFHLRADELDNVGRGCTDPDLAPLIDAAERMSHAEDEILFNGLGSAGIRGILGASPHKALRVDGVQHYPQVVLAGREVLRRAGVGEPYVLALNNDAYDELLAAREQGHPLANQIESLLESKLVSAPCIEGAALLSVRGGDYQFTLGHDLSVGYAGHVDATIDFYLVESFTFRVLEPSAAIRLERV